MFARRLQLSGIAAYYFSDRPRQNMFQVCDPTRSCSPQRDDGRAPRLGGLKNKLESVYKAEKFNSHCHLWRICVERQEVHVAKASKGRV
jgi:hypothetical protein